MLAGGIIFNLLGFTTLEHFAASLETGECHINIWGVINSMPTTILETMVFGMVCFCVAAGFDEGFLSFCIPILILYRESL